MERETTQSSDAGSTGGDCRESDSLHVPRNTDQLPPEPALPASARAVIVALTQRVQALEALVAAMSGPVSRVESPHQRVFPVIVGEGGTFTELTVDGGEPVEFSDGRSVDDEDHPGALIDAAEALPDDEVALAMEFRDVDDDGNAVYRYLIVGSPDVCDAEESDGSLGDASEGSEAADTDSMDNPDGITGTIWLQSRTGYFHEGDEKLYGYARGLTFECGKLVAVTAETRYEVDNPEDC